MKENTENLNNTDTTEEYETPSVRVLDEAEILATIQINAGATSWWVM